MVMKKCKICGKEFDAKGRQVCCSDECKKINRKMNAKKRYDKYYENNKEERKEYYKNWYDENKEERKEYYKNWYDENKEERKKYWEKYWEKYFNRNNGLVGGDERKDKHGNIISILGSSYDDYAYDAEKEMEKAKKANDKIIDDFLNELNL